MDYALRCNSQPCRKQLTDRACVTTCSHIFCVDCANQLNITRRVPGQQNLCPACQSSLPNQDDIVITTLNPAEDYKTSVLSGLSPHIIMECAGRALSFWAYQATQEIVFNEFAHQTVSDSHKALGKQFDKMIHDANAEIANLREQNANLQNDIQQIMQKNREMTTSLHERTRKHLQTQELYDKLKQKAMLGQVKNAAYESATDTIQASIMANRYTDVSNEAHGQPSFRPLFQAQPIVGSNSMSYSNNHHQMAPPPIIPSRGSGGNWNNFATNQPVQTPTSTHRQRVGSDGGGGYGGGAPLGDYHPDLTHQQQPQRSNLTPRQAFGQVSGNESRNVFPGYGLSAGLKVSGPPGSAMGIRPVNRSRVAQRPASGLEGRPLPLFNTSNTNMFSNTNNGR